MPTDAYRGTEVPFYKSFMEIEKLLAKHGLRGSCVHMMEDRWRREPGFIVVLFGRRLRKDGPEIPYRIRMPYQYQPGNRGSNAGTTADQIARLMLNFLKNKLEAVNEVIPFDQEFLPYQMVSEEATVYDTLAPRLGELNAAEVPSVFPRALGWSGEKR